jgi:hypothetical protein
MMTPPTTTTAPTGTSPVCDAIAASCSASRIKRLCSGSSSGVVSLNTDWATISEDYRTQNREVRTQRDCNKPPL